MSLFARYYKDEKLIVVTMEEMDKLIMHPTHKNIIAEHIYFRFYERFLKPFDYNGIDSFKFNHEFKSGFAMMACCMIVIESMSTFLTGKNQSNSGSKSFYKFFHKAKLFENGLSVFLDKRVYSDIRCGILHQGETYGKFKILRKGELFNPDENSINATKFFKSLKQYLLSYQKELQSEEWDSLLWINCRKKIGNIIKNNV